MTRRWRSPTPSPPTPKAPTPSPEPGSSPSTCSPTSTTWPRTPMRSRWAPVRSPTPNSPRSPTCCGPTTPTGTRASPRSGECGSAPPPGTSPRPTCTPPIAGLPSIGGVRVSATSGNQSATDLWLAGEIDYVSVAIPDLEEHVEANPHLAYTNTGISQMALMASSNPDLGSEGPQTDVAVRKALYYGMDREQLSKLAFFDLGSDISPSFALPERDADFIDPSIELAPWNAQPEEATAILEDAGYELGSDGIYAKDDVRLSMTISCPTGWSDYVTALDTLAEQYKQIGIELVPQQVSVNEWNDAKAKGTYELLIDSVGQGPAPDPYYPYRTHF